MRERVVEGERRGKEEKGQRAIEERCIAASFTSHKILKRRTLQYRHVSVPTRYQNKEEGGWEREST